MKAIKLVPGTTEVRCTEHDEPQILEGDEIKLKVLEVGICGTDRELAAGGRALAPEGEKELILGHEMLGEVIEIGKKVRLFKKGDLAVVTVRRGCKECDLCRNERPDLCMSNKYKERGIKESHGFQSTYVVDQEKFLVKIPHSLRSSGVLCEPMSVVEKAIEELLAIQKFRLPNWSTRKELKHKQTLVVGLGPIGLLSCAVLLLRGFKVYAQDIVSSDSPRAKIVEEMGGIYIDGRETKYREFEDKFGQIDIIIEATGNAQLALSLLDALGMNGGTVFTGIPDPKSSFVLEGGYLINRLVLRNQVLLGSVNAAKKHWELAVLDLVKAKKKWGGVLEKLITTRVPYHQYKDLFSEKQSHEIKVVLKWE